MLCWLPQKIKNIDIKKIIAFSAIKIKAFSEKYPNILSFKLFGWVFCLFWFNRYIKTLCFSIEAKQPKKTFSNQGLLFVLVQ